MSIPNLFDMQNKMLSHMLECRVRAQTDDIILCAPTGSGKTLAYALPILQAIQDRVFARLRAIVVVPTRDLAAQVAHVFKTLTEGTPVKVAIVTGAAPTAEEARTLKTCEILIATPGRLVDHIQNGDSLVLTHVRYLVLDESDRLLQESYDNWLEILMPLLGKLPEGDKSDDTRLWRPITGVLSLAIVPRVASMAASAYGTASDDRICKILVSATQSQDPTHMVHLDMRHPTIFQIESQPSKVKQAKSNAGDESSKPKYSVPSTLLETGCVIRNIQEKPAALLHILGWATDTRNKFANLSVQPGNGSKLVFTNSIEAAHRLCRLLELCSYILGRSGAVFEMSGELSAERRREVVNYVKQQPQQGSDTSSAPVIVCSDVLSRGMDIFTVDCVINYDAPAHVRTYLHRAGRTARAGRSGTVVTLLLAKQVHHFRVMVHEAERGDKTVKTSNVRTSDCVTSEVKDLLYCSLPALKRVVKREKLELLPREKALPSYALYELSNRDGSSDVDEDGDAEEDYLHPDFIDRELHGNDGRKRKRLSPDADADNIDEPLDGENVFAKEEREGEDTLSDLLYAQIAKNLMLNV